MHRNRVWLLASVVAVLTVFLGMILAQDPIDVHSVVGLGIMIVVCIVAWWLDGWCNHRMYKSFERVLDLLRQREAQDYPVPKVKIGASLEQVITNYKHTRPSKRKSGWTNAANKFEEFIEHEKLVDRTTYPGRIRKWLRRRLSQ